MTPLDFLAAQASSPALTEVEIILDRFSHFGVELGLERIQRLLAALGDPQLQVPILHVAGSNGKGSVCAYLSAVLTEAGYRVGRYNSPHLVSWCERICLNQQAILADELLRLLQQVVAAIDPTQPSPTQFEVITAVAWLYFAQQQVDLAVIEVGLGGRLDATNVCDQPLVSVITSLSREHWQRLGSTLAQISREKAGILKPNRPAVIAPQPVEAEAVLKQRLADLNCPAYWVQPAEELGQGQAKFGAITYPLPLLGAHQLINSALAIQTLQILQAQGWQISDGQIVAGLAQTQWPGRLQWLTWQGQPLLIDGAHNPAGAAMLRRYVDQELDQSIETAPGSRTGQPIHWIMGMIGTKDHADIFKALLRPGDWLYLVPVPEHIPVDLTDLEAIAKAACPQLAASRCYADVTDGVQAALETIQANQHQANQSGGGTAVLCGSLYLIGHFFKRAILREQF